MAIYYTYAIKCIQTIKLYFYIILWKHQANLTLATCKLNLNQEDPGLRIESFAITNLRTVSTKIITVIFILTNQERTYYFRELGRSFLEFDCFNNHLKLVLVNYK